MHISDSLQEFLSVSDRMKLVQYDNKKLKEFKAYIEETKPEVILSEEEL